MATPATNSFNNQGPNSPGATAHAAWVMGRTRVRRLSYGSVESR